MVNVDSLLLSKYIAFPCDDGLIQKLSLQMIIDKACEQVITDASQRNLFRSRGRANILLELATIWRDVADNS